MKKKTVLITGCSSGIGKALALAMHQKKYHVYASARDKNRLTELEQAGINTLELDVVSEESIQNALSVIQKKGDNIDILVNNAGYGAIGPLAEMPQSELEQQFKVNVFGPITLIRHLVPTMQEQGDGLIVNIGSVSGVLITPFSGAYCATKAAIHAVSEALRMELAPFHIRVLEIQPGAIESEFGNNAEASIERTINDASLYQNVKDGIIKRAQSSQTNPTPIKHFIHELLKTIEKPTPPAIKRIGHGSLAMPLIANLPGKIRSHFLSRSFGLNRLKRINNGK